MPAAIAPAPYATSHCAWLTTGTSTRIGTSDSEPPSDVVPQPATVSGTPADSRPESAAPARVTSS